MTQGIEHNPINFASYGTKIFGNDLAGAMDCSSLLSSDSLHPDFEHPDLKHPDLKHGGNVYYLNPSHSDIAKESHDGTPHANQRDTDRRVSNCNNRRPTTIRT